MCVGEIVADCHTCVNVCPVCHVFTAENISQLISGADVELGLVDMFIEVAQRGCRVCQWLCEAWSLNDEIFQPGNQVSVKKQEDGPPGLLLAVLFEIREPFNFDRLNKGTGSGRAKKFRFREPNFDWMHEGTGSYRDKDEIREPFDFDRMLAKSVPYHEKKFKSWAVPFGIYKKGSEFLDHVIIMRPPDPSVTRHEVFDAFKVDLEACLSDHKECQKPDPNKLPTRVLRLDDDDPNRVFVHECRQGEQGEYVALSYCWGKTAQVKLLKVNLDDFSRKGIEVGTLPKTVEDSIITTRKLAIKYLWIDSLCIIQDSTEDKDKEIVSMANVYKNATITISAASATDCGQGFLEDRSEVQTRLNISLCLPFIVNTTDEETHEAAVDWVYLCPDPYMGHKVKLFSEEAINTRAWTFQESTLAPRLLIFGSGPPQWHCKEKWRISGLNIHPKNLPNPEFTSGGTKITKLYGSTVANQSLRYRQRPAPPKDDIGSWLTWFPVLQNYSQRALSYPTDKLTALSALAAEHQSSENGAYAAGLWNASLPRGLLWRRSSSEKDNVVKNHAQQQANPLFEAHPLNWLRTRLFDTSSSIGLPELSPWSAKYIAPTWSPMSSRDPICFESAATQEKDEYHTSLVEINDIHVELTTNLNPFGRLNFGYLEVKGPICSISWQDLTANFIIVSNGEPFAYWDFIVPDDPAFFKGMSEKYAPSLNPQELADMSVKDPIVDDDCSIIFDEGTRIRMPVVREPASLDCPDADTPFTSVADVKQAVINALHPETPGTSRLRHRESKGPVVAENDECEFWLLEVERSMSPAGLVLKCVKGDIFARVGYFGVNRSLDPEIVSLPGGMRVRGRKTWNLGRPEGKNDWNDRFTRRRIYLV